MNSSCHRPVIPTSVAMFRHLYLSASDPRCQSRDTPRTPRGVVQCLPRCPPSAPPNLAPRLAHRDQPSPGPPCHPCRMSTDKL
ncbi:hypothetical protein CKAH01_13134 [Colletotrichum kahawae]|uniref:Uncharacterized protein n=1 Tax=Colletotrichum kahawae TaxID=34407 RepID=A0AAD9YTJ9_COLKA|nr:hypothetical protein CKAH01_13134 [Colletotrichum kahawae]